MTTRCSDCGLQLRLELLLRFAELGYLEERRNIDAKANEPRRYRIADPAFRFHQRFVEPNLSLLERTDPLEVWRTAIEDKMPNYMGLKFERIAVQAYDRFRAQKSLPLVAEWGRWEGRDRAGRSLEIDLVARLAECKVLTGDVNWSREPVSIALHYRHLEMLDRAAHAGQRWAHEALEDASVIYYLAAAGFEEGFLKRAEENGRTTICWSLEDIYG